MGKWIGRLLFEMRSSDEIYHHNYHQHDNQLIDLHQHARHPKHHQQMTPPHRLPSHDHHCNNHFPNDHYPNEHHYNDHYTPTPTIPMTTITMTTTPMTTTTMTTAPMTTTPMTTITITTTPMTTITITTTPMTTIKMTTTPMTTITKLYNRALIALNSAANVTLRLDSRWSIFLGEYYTKSIWCYSKLLTGNTGKLTVLGSNPSWDVRVYCIVG